MRPITPAAAVIEGADALRGTVNTAEVVTVQHLVKRYGNLFAANDVSFSIREGEIFGIIGPNGAGKTTTVECISELRAPNSGQTLVVAEGAQGPRRYQFYRQRVGECREDLPGRECWLLLRRKVDGSDLKYCLSNAAVGTPLLKMGHVGASRWHIETEFELEKSEAGLVDYEVRSWVGWYHHMSMALLAGAFLLQLQQEWGENMPQITRPQVSRVVRELLPRRTWTAADLIGWLHETQERNEWAKRSHSKRRAVEQVKPDTS